MALDFAAIFLAVLVLTWVVGRVADALCRRIDAHFDRHYREAKERHDRTRRLP